jgi:2-polyprenyl-3-methyl-5-hydroxy-6-metoxy-1,4-benzoquinol methylase/tetratricopeptide (TPR) repeat protein
MNRKQRRMVAKLGKHTGPAVTPGATGGRSVQITDLLASARRHHENGQLTEAETHYRKILTIDQNHFDSLHLLGVIAHQLGRNDQAVHLIRKAIALKDRNATFHDNIELVVGASGRSEHPLARFELAAAYSNLCIVLMAMGDSIQALRSIQRSIQIEETDNAKLLFVQCLQALSFIPSGIDLRDNLIRALSEPWRRPQDLSRFVANLLKCDGATGVCIRRFISAWPRRLSIQELFSSAELAEVCRDRLLRCLLEETNVFDIELERFLTATRQMMLEAAGTASDGFGEDMLRFFCALAQQCFVNEYIFACTDHEKEQADRLRVLLIEALASGTSIPEPWLVAVAAFFPLASLPGADLLVERRWSAPVIQLVARHVRERQEERRLEATVSRLTAINDSVSLAVQQQYEENPYPRWMKASPVGKPTTINAYLRQQFPLVDLHKIANTTGAEILIAGCGTGQHSIETARQFKGACVLAIDLSLTSLSYAKRKTRDLALKNIEYAQADILQLQSIGRTFDVIEASGVLHHLADPMAGWRVLLSILRPGGFMRLGLYSKLARRDLIAARNFIGQRRFGISAEEIRRCRQELTHVGADTSLGKVTEWVDFFSTSTCRDLLFHIQEHQLTLPEIASFLRQNGLEFLGFGLAGGVLQNFKRRFPNDTTATDLAHWHIFETENPSIFAGMYQFWIQKPVISSAVNSHD